MNVVYSALRPLVSVGDFLLRRSARGRSVQFVCMADSRSAPCVWRTARQPLIQPRVYGGQPFSPSLLQHPLATAALACGPPAAHHLAPLIKTVGHSAPVVRVHAGHSAVCMPDIQPYIFF